MSSALTKRVDRLERLCTRQSKPVPAVGPKGLRILDFVETYTAANGCAPTLAEIARRFGLKSLATVHAHLEKLGRAGLIERQWNYSRSIRLTGACPYCGAETRP